MKGKIVQDAALLGHFAKTDVRYWQRTVFRQTYTRNDCYTIFIDSKENNPSLRTLVRPFLTKNRTKDPRLSDELARIYSDRSPYWPDAAVVGEFSAEDQRALIAKNEKANAERRLAFERILDRLARDWARLDVQVSTSLFFARTSLRIQFWSAMQRPSATLIRKCQSRRSFVQRLKRSYLLSPAQ